MKKTPEDIIILQKCTINDNHMMYCYWNMGSNGQNFLSFWTIFYPFNPLLTQKIKLKKKQRNKCLKICVTCVPKIMSYAILFLRYGAWQMWLLFFILGYFLPFNPPPPNSLKKTANISSFHTSVPKIMITYTSIQKIMIIYYTVPKIWHVMDVIVIFHFGLSFALTVPKMKIFKKWKKWLDISSFYTSVPKIMIICYTVPMIWHMTGVIVIFHFGLFFALLPS